MIGCFVLWLVFSYVCTPYRYPIAPADNQLTCASCGNGLLQSGDVCLYQESAKQEHVIVKPCVPGECSADVPARHAHRFYSLPEANPKKARFFPFNLICRGRSGDASNACQGRVGKGGKIGPDGEIIWCFGRDKVAWHGIVLSSAAAHSLLTSLEVRTKATLFGESGDQQGGNSCVDSSVFGK